MDGLLLRKTECVFMRYKREFTKSDFEELVLHGRMVKAASDCATD